MRKLFGVVAAAFIGMGVTGQAHAVVLPFVGVLTFEIANLEPIVIPSAPPMTAFVNGSGAAGHLTELRMNAALFEVHGSVLTVSDPVAFPIAGVKITAVNGDGMFAGNGGAGFGGVMPIFGVAKVCLFATCSAAVANLHVPLTVVGRGGAAFETSYVNMTVIGAPWTTRTAAVNTTTTMGGVSPLSNTGAPSGNVKLVTPIFISTNIGSSAIIPAFGILNLHFVPEPGTLMLLGSGIAGLIVFGRSKRVR